jgi:hypothetical protein
MVVDVASRKFSFGFALSCFGTFSVLNLDVEVEPYLQNLCEEASNMATVSEVWPSGVSSISIMADFLRFRLLSGRLIVPYMRLNY